MHFYCFRSTMSRGAGSARGRGGGQPVPGVVSHRGSQSVLSGLGHVPLRVPLVRIVSLGGCQSVLSGLGLVLDLPEYSLGLHATPLAGLLPHHVAG